jgi:uncharacterized protein
MSEAESPELMNSRKPFQIAGLLDEIEPMYENADPAHDFSHAMRVFRAARAIGQDEGADMQVLLLAALLHDAGSEKKVSPEPEDHGSLRLRRIEEWLTRTGLPEDVRKKVLYAIEVHRFSAGITPSTLEARVLQDADRLDALGAIGIARVFLTGGSLGRLLYNPADPFCRTREPDDRKWNLDHFFRKLLKLEHGMHTRTGKRLAGERAAVLRRYLSDLETEIGDGLMENGLTVDRLILDGLRADGQMEDELKASDQASRREPE